jgi:hypothetical protein
MDSKDLAFIFAPLVFGDDGLLNSQSQDSVMETLIDNAHILLDECSPFSSPSPSPVYPRGRIPVMDDDSMTTSTMVQFPQFGDITPQTSPRPLSPTRSLETLYSSTLSTPPISPSGSSVHEELSREHTPTQAPAPLLPQLPDFPSLQIFTESASSELPVRVQIFPDDTDRTPKLHLQPANSTYTPDRSNLSIPRPRSAMDSLKRRSPAQAIQRSLTPDTSSLRMFLDAQEKHSQEQDVTRLGTGSINERSRYPSEVSLVPSLPRFAPQQQRRPPPLSIPGTLSSTRTSMTDYRHSSATSLASRDFALPGSFNFND